MVWSDSELLAINYQQSKTNENIRPQFMASRVGSGRADDDDDDYEKLEQWGPRAAAGVLHAAYHTHKMYPYMT